MEEKILSNRKNGMAVLFATLLYAAAIAGIILGAFSETFWLLAVCIAWCALGWILFCGLRVLRPQEALVLTLFGKYVGTLKEAGFYWVNPFCTSVNPAAKTHLNQSGDVNSGSLY